MNVGELRRIAAAMVADGKGLLAADESGGTIKKRFDKIGLSSTEESRRGYRELLFTTPGMAQWVSGVILFDETLRQRTAAGQPFTELLQRNGVLPGIKVDQGAKPLAAYPGETITEGLDGLRERLAEYHGLGAKFAKWRAVIDIDTDVPSRAAIELNAQALARYAALCQEAGLVPIVEPEVLMDGDHTIERCEAVTDAVLGEVFAQLQRCRIELEGMILKPNMVISGKRCAVQAPPPQVAEATVRCLRRRVPVAVPGIMFLSGGQSPLEATTHLSLINQLAAQPWKLSFSFGRALQDAALAAWGGKSEGVAAGQREFARWARLNSLACAGRFVPGMESQGA